MILGFVGRRGRSRTQPTRPSADAANVRRGAQVLLDQGCHLAVLIVVRAEDHTLVPGHRFLPQVLRVKRVRTTPSMARRCRQRFK